MRLCPGPIIYGPRLRKIRYMAATTAGAVTRYTARRNSIHSHQGTSMVTLTPRTSYATRGQKCVGGHDHPCPLSSAAARKPASVIQKNPIGTPPAPLVVM